MGYIAAAFGAAGYTGGLDMTLGQQSGNSTYISWNQWIDKAPGYSGPWGTSGTASAYTPGCGPCNGNAGGDFRANGTGGHRFIVNSGGTWVGHDGNGNLYVAYGSVITNSYMGTSHPADGGEWARRIPEAPGQVPSVGNFTNVTPTSVSFSWGAAGRGHADITNYQWRILNASGSTQLYIVEGGVFYSDNTADNYTLTPGTTYLFQVRAKNGDGYGAWSNTASIQTIIDTPPLFTVSPSPSGISATVNLSPPGGMSGVTSYGIEMRPKGSGTATRYDTTTNTYTVNGLTPGASYEWRTTAFVGTYQSPWSSWLTVVQPNPSTSPGDYFDGSTAATADQTYKWTGAVNNSTSQAVGHAPTGWMNFAEAAVKSGGTGAIVRVSDPRYGSFGARATFFSNATAAGFEVGPSGKAVGRADVAIGETYYGSIFVKPSRSQNMAAQIIYYNAAGAIIQRSVGTPQVVAAGGWQQLGVVAKAPALGEWATVTAIDVAGTGWSLWKGGESIALDAAMLSLSGVPTDYFDGSFPDTSGFSYSWTGTANASTSIREDIPVNLADALIDPDCPPVPAPPRPPAIPDPCIADIGLWRRYYAEIPATEVSDWLDTLPTFTLKTFGLAERQVRIRIYANPFGYPPSQVDTTTWCGEQIISYIPASTTMVLDGEIQRVFASVAGGATSSADHLLYGTGGTPASWPVLSCGMSYLISFDTPIGGTTPPAGNITVNIDLTRRT